MRPLIVAISLTVVGVTAGGCFLQDQIFGDNDRDFVRARVTFGFEEAALRPCGSDEQWWIVGSDNAIIELQDRWTALGLEWYQHGYAEVRGERSRTGEYGHLGLYQREFAVTEVLEVRLLEEGECRWPRTER